jgi:hypothetical protein
LAEALATCCALVLGREKTLGLTPAEGRHYYEDMRAFLASLGCDDRIETALAGKLALGIDPCARNVLSGVTRGDLRARWASLKWHLDRAARPLSADEVRRRSRQREWILARLDALPEGWGLYDRSEAVAAMSRKFQNPYDPHFHRPMTAEQFARFQDECHRLEAALRRHRASAPVAALWLARRRTTGTARVIREVEDIARDMQFHQGPVDRKGILRPPLSIRLPVPGEVTGYLYGSGIYRFDITFPPTPQIP